MFCLVEIFVRKFVGGIQIKQIKIEQSSFVPHNTLSAFEGYTRKYYRNDHPIFHARVHFDVFFFVFIFSKAICASDKEKIMSSSERINEQVRSR